MDHRPRGTSTLRRLSLLAASCGLAVVGWFLFGESEQSLAQAPPRPVLARVDGVDITEDEVNGLAADALAELALRRHQVILETTRGEVRRRLLKAEAGRRGITSEELQGLEADLPGLIARLEQSHGVEYLIAPAEAGGEGAGDPRTPASAR